MMSPFPSPSLADYPAHLGLFFQGHVFDSLTLNKAMDTILTLGGHFLITNISIGVSKTDTSTVHLTLHGKDDAHLADMMKVLEVYGAQRQTEAVSQLAKVQKMAMAPTNAAVIGYVPTFVALKETTLPAGRMVHNPVVLVKRGDELVPTQESHLLPGDEVVVGPQGFRWEAAATAEQEA
jgi:hypothetical protein